MPSRKSGSRSSSLEAVVTAVAAFAATAAALVEDLKKNKRISQNIDQTYSRLTAAKAFVEIQLHKGLWGHATNVREDAHTGTSTNSVK